MKWIHKEEKSYRTVGNSDVPTLGRWKIRAGLQLQSSEKSMPISLEGNEQSGSHPLLLSNSAQAQLKMVKDIEKRTCYIKDHKDYLKLYRAKDTGLLVVCISNWQNVWKEIFGDGKSTNWHVENKDMQCDDNLDKYEDAQSNISDSGAQGKMIEWKHILRSWM